MRMLRKYSVTSLAIFFMFGVMLAGCVPKESQEKPALKRDSQVVVQTVAEGYVNISTDQLKAKIDARGRISSSSMSENPMNTKQAISRVPNYCR